MAGDFWKKPATGDKLVIPAQWYAAVTDAAKAYHAGLNRRGGGPFSAGTPEGLIWVQNNTGADRARFDVMGIDSVIFGPSDNMDEFAANAAFNGRIPTTAGDLGTFVICAEPIASGEIGRAFVHGVCPVQINMVNATDAFADVTDSDCTQLTSGPTGAALILWQENASGTGKMWAFVRFGGGGKSAGLLFGTLTAVWTPGQNIVTLQPCRGFNDTSAIQIRGVNVPTVQCYVSLPYDVPARCLDVAAGKILAYMSIGPVAATDNLLVSPPALPSSTVKGQTVQNNSAVAGSPNWVSDYARTV